MSQQYYSPTLVVTRGVSPAITRCELTHIARRPIDVAKAVKEQRDYEQALAELGARVISLPAAAELPDCVFVQDTALVIDEVAVIARMGTAGRRPEVPAVSELLSSLRRLEFINHNATLEGGDLVRIGRTLYVGISGRTSRDGFEQLRNFVEPFGYQAQAVEVKGCLHLSTGFSYVGRNTAMINSSWVDSQAIEGLDLIDVSGSEPWAANALMIGGAVVVSNSFPKTRDELQRRGFRVRAVDISELEKAEAGPTCLSLIIEGPSEGLF